MTKRKPSARKPESEMIFVNGDTLKSISRRSCSVVWASSSAESALRHSGFSSSSKNAKTKTKTKGILSS